MDFAQARARILDALDPLEPDPSWLCGAPQALEAQVRALIDAWVDDVKQQLKAALQNGPIVIR